MNNLQYKSFLLSSIDNIRNASNNSKLSIFIGTGISMNSGLPSFAELINHFVIDLGMTRKIDYSIDECIIIPEKYYLQYGENQYYKTIEKYLPTNVKPTKLHNIIFDLKPQFIITTNFDNLLEKTINNLGESYHIIKSDNDLSFSNNQKLLIKMHGDLELKNIILKESDYLSYSDKFPLVENYIKSIFSTNITMFLGYSLNDYDLRQILQWLRNRQDYALPIYLVKNGVFDYIEFEYYKSKRIYIIYLDSFLEFLSPNYSDDEEDNYGNPPLSSIGLKYYCSLKYLSQNNINIKDIDCIKFIDEIILSLKPLLSFNYILPEQIIKILRNKFDLNNINELVYDKSLRCIYINNQEILDKFQILKDLISKRHTNKDIVKEIMTKIKKVIFIFRKTDISLININGNISYKIYNVFDFSDFNFNFEKIREELHNIELKENQNNEYSLISLKQAYLYYENMEYNKALKLLKSISYKSFVSHKYVLYFIAECNIQYISILAELELVDNNKKDRPYFKESNKKDLKRIFFSLSNNDQVYLEPVFDLLYNFSVFYKYIYSTDKNKNDINYVITSLIEVYNFIDSFFLMVAHYGEVKKIFYVCIEIILEFSYSKKKEIPNEILYFIIKYLKKDDIYTLFANYSNKSKNKLLISEIDKEHLLNIYKNIENEFVKEQNIGGRKRSISDYYYNTLFLLSYFDINKDNVDYIVSSFCTVISKSKLLIDDFKTMVYFIKNKHQEDKKILNAKKIANIIDIFIRKFIGWKLNGFEFELLKGYNSLFEDLINIIKENEDGYMYDNENLIKSFIFELENYKDNEEKKDEQNKSVIDGIKNYYKGIDNNILENLMVSLKDSNKLTDKGLIVDNFLKPISTISTEQIKEIINRYINKEKDWQDTSFS